MTATDRVINQIEYRDTGVMLSLKPRVMPGGLVQMEIEQEVSTVEAESGTVNSPTFRTRNITSNVAVRSNQAVVLVKLLSFLRDNGKLTVAMTGNAHSTLAKNSSFHLSVPVAKEACPLQLAPTASTTATLAMGDALAVALMKARNFQPQDFARFHPGGSLGRRLLHRVREEMRGHDLPFVGWDASADEVLAAVTRGRLGMALVSNDRETVVGIITDGDVRRALQAHKAGFYERRAAELMTSEPITIGADSNVQ